MTTTDELSDVSAKAVDMDASLVEKKVQQVGSICIVLEQEALGCRISTTLHSSRGFVATHSNSLIATMQMMSQLGFVPEDADRLIASFSGGWQMRVCIGKILLQVRFAEHLWAAIVWWLESISGLLTILFSCS